VATGVFSSPPDHLRSGFLFEYDDVLTGSEKRKLGKLDMAKLADLAVVLVVLGREQDGAIDGFISERGLARRSDMYDRTALEQALAGSERLPRKPSTSPTSWPCQHFLKTQNVWAGN
jgi:hypothetical protein